MPRHILNSYVNEIFSGNIEVTSISGDIKCSSISGFLKAFTKEGSIEAKLTSGGNIDATSLNGKWKMYFIFSSNLNPAGINNIK